MYHGRAIAIEDSSVLMLRCRRHARREAALEAQEEERVMIRRLTWLSAVLLAAPASGIAQVKCSDFTWTPGRWGILGPSAVVQGANQRFRLGPAGSGTSRVPWVDESSRSLATSFASRVQRATVLESLAWGLIGAGALDYAVNRQTAHQRRWGFVVSAFVVEAAGFHLRNRGMRRLGAAVEQHNSSCP